MDFELREGVRLHILPNQQFKTTQIVVNLTTKHQQTTITKRSLLANILELGTQRYPDQTKIAQKLASMYGANFGTDLQKYGQLHSFRFMMRIVNEKFLQTSDNLLTEAVAFLQDAIFNPLTENNQFNQAIFDREKENMQADFEALVDDKQSYANSQLAQLYFQNEMAIPSYGQINDLTPLTAENLYTYYQTMLAEDLIDIFVIGDVDEQQIVTLFEKLPFSPRPVIDIKLNYQQPLKETVSQKIEQQPLKQAKLNMAFQIPHQNAPIERYAAIVLNALLGGYPLSKLFVNVREKASLAYYAQSGVSLATQTLTVQTGIQSSDLSRVIALVQEQVVAIQQGDFTEEEIQQIIAYLINSFEASLDSPRSIVERATIQALSKKVTAPAQWVANLQKVTKEDVQHLAQKIKLQAIFALVEENYETN
ncbi:EF-P 5-aminopentanol modification-associated protein YfmF [Periweissella fabalis]|uniref:Insulinase family protein n=1 Tax=Periweissella fabalis TaxID=1070421 RepID=A0A7X6N490_9LACO|nr:pitrilysin family protein [Periweissella fabalis]MCM0598676.1 insulinase family protein [Periweissella fabalis]NKZ24329.1 insulinase family protein [Periweissella fabalis]